MRECDYKQNPSNIYNLFRYHWTVTESYTRRALLKRVGVGCAAGVVGGVALPGRSSSLDGTGEIVGSVDPDSVPVDKSDTPYAVWQYRAERGRMVPTAPVNVVFPLDAATFADVIDVFESAGWYSGPAEYARYAWDRGEQRYRLQQWTGAETHFGLAGRLHVRCWALDGTASVQAHVDTPATLRHQIASYADARDAVEQLFREAGWTVADERERLGNDKQPDHDGMATVIHGGGRQ